MLQLFGQICDSFFHIMFSHKHNIWEWKALILREERSNQYYE
jgi:hypothetical protein